MFTQINSQNDPTIKAFVNRYEYNVCVNSILDGNTKGLVFADNAQSPTIALVFEFPNVLYLIGKLNSIDDFNNDFKKVLNETFIPICEREDKDFLLVTFIDKHYWKEYTDKVIEEHYLQSGNRWQGEFDQEYYQKFKSTFPKTLPDGYALCKINKEIIESYENKELKENILTSWISIDTFLAKGFGFCILQGSKVICFIISYNFSDNLYYEITIETIDEQERKKSFATHCIIAYIDYCLENNYLPHWMTDFENEASQNLATKIAFPKHHNTLQCSFIFNKADNYLDNTLIYFDSKELNLGLILFSIDKAFEDINIKPKQKYLYRVAYRLAENGIKDWVFFLLDELFKSDLKHLDHVKKVTVFKPLFDTGEWKDLMLKYKN